MRLESLKLNETALTDKGLLKLKVLRNLRHLEVHQTGRDRRGREVEQSLPRWKW